MGAGNIEALLRGLGQGASFGFADEVSPYVTRGLEAVFGGPADPAGMKRVYARGSAEEDAKAVERAANADMAAKYPMNYGAGQFLGALPANVAAGAAGVGGPLASQIAKQGLIGGLMGGIGGAGRATEGGRLEGAANAAGPSAALSMAAAGAPAAAGAVKNLFKGGGPPPSALAPATAGAAPAPRAPTPAAKGPTVNMRKTDAPPRRPPGARPPPAPPREPPPPPTPSTRPTARPTQPPPDEALLPETAPWPKSPKVPAEYRAGDKYKWGPNIEDPQELPKARLQRLLDNEKALEAARNPEPPRPKTAAPPRRKAKAGKAMLPPAQPDSPDVSIPKSPAVPAEYSAGKKYKWGPTMREEAEEGQAFRARERGNQAVIDKERNLHPIKRLLRDKPNIDMLDAQDAQALARKAKEDPNSLEFQLADTEYAPDPLEFDLRGSKSKGVTVEKTNKTPAGVEQSSVSIKPGRPKTEPLNIEDLMDLEDAD